MELLLAVLVMIAAASDPRQTVRAHVAAEVASPCGCGRSPATARPASTAARRREPCARLRFRATLGGINPSRRNARGLHSVTHRGPGGVAFLLVPDHGPSIKLSVDRHGVVVVQFDLGPAAPIGQLHAALEVRSDELVARLCARQVLRPRAGAYYAAEVLAPGERCAEHAPSAAGPRVDLDSFAGRYVAVYLIDENSGDVVAAPGQQLVAGFAAAPRRSLDGVVATPAFASPIEIVAPEHEQRARAVFATTWA